MTMSDFLLEQDSPRRGILSAIHRIITETDRQVKPEVGPMLGNEMIIYKQSGVFKYGLSSPKSHMSLHLMPMYGSPAIRSKYSKLLKRAKFQKGCINFKKEDEMPVGTVKDLIRDCAAVDYSSAIERYKKRQSTIGHGRRSF